MPKRKTPYELFDGPKSLDHWRQTSCNSNERWTRSDGLTVGLELIGETIDKQLEEIDKKNPMQ
jgi:hypothetical protein